jgi:hypothetical protein
MSTSTLLPLESITHRILMLRGHCERVELKAPGTRRRPPCREKVLLDSDLAALYDVPTKRFNEQVKRNLERFPADFMFQLTEEEWESLRSQIATLKPGRGQHRKYMPYAFTEHGTIMAATILNSPRATEVSVGQVQNLL